MSATWVLETKVTSLPERRLCVTATRTDGVNKPWSKTVTTRVAPGGVDAAKIEVGQELRRLYLAYAAENEAHAEFLGAFSADIAGWLNGQEA